MSSRFDWLIDRLINDEYVEDIEHLTEEEAKEVLAIISSRTGKTYTLIIHINNEVDGVYYDAVLDTDTKNSVLFEEWDNT